MKVRSSTRATSPGTGAGVKAARPPLLIQPEKVPAATSRSQIASYSACEPSTQWIESGRQSSAIFSTQRMRCRFVVSGAVEGDGSVASGISCCWAPPAQYSACWFKHFWLRAARRRERHDSSISDAAPPLPLAGIKGHADSGWKGRAEMKIDCRNRAIEGCIGRFHRHYRTLSLRSAASHPRLT